MARLCLLLTLVPLFATAILAKGHKGAKDSKSRVTLLDLDMLPSCVSWNPTPNPMYTCRGRNEISNEVNARPARWDDCRTLKDQWEQFPDNGYFDVDTPSHAKKKKRYFLPTLQYGTCHFAISPPTCGGVTVGDFDIKRILHEALSVAANGVMVTAEGSLYCELMWGSGQVTETRWRIHGGPDEKTKEKDKSKGKTKDKTKDRTKT